MTLLMLHGATAVGAITPIAHGNTCVILIPDEVATGVECTIYVQIVDENGPVAMDGPPQIGVWGFTSAGLRTAERALAYASQVGSAELWSLTWTPSASGVFEVKAVGEVATTAFVAALPVTARPKFDSIAIADSDTLVSRMDADAVLGTA